MKVIDKEIIVITKEFLGQKVDSNIVKGTVKRVKINIKVNNELIYNDIKEPLSIESLEKNALKYLEGWLSKRVTKVDKFQSQFNIRGYFCKLFSFRG